MYAWALIILQATSVHSNRVVYGYTNIGTFATHNECVMASKELALQSNQQRDEIGVNSIAKFNCIRVLNK